MAGIVHFLLLIALAATMKSSSSDSDSSPSSSSYPLGLNSSSVLVGLLESPYTDFVELIEKSSVLQSLEEEVGRHNVTILAPPNSCFEGPAQESFRRFLLEPGNIRLLRRLIEFHVVPARRVTAARWPSIGSSFKTLSSDFLHFWTLGNKLKVGFITVVAPDAIVRYDGVVHGVDAFLVPKIVQQAFSHWKKNKNSNSFPQSQAQVPSGPRRRMIGTEKTSGFSEHHSVAPAPGTLLDVENYIVKGLVSSLFQYRHYSELADILVNMTSLASELARLVKEGYRLTILAPSNEAFGELTQEQLIAPEQTVLYHIIPEYQTESSLYHSVRRFRKVDFETLRFPFKISARESEGAVEWMGEGNSTARLYDNDIYADGLISVQGIDKLLVVPRGKNKGRAR